MSKVWLITEASRGLGRAFAEEALRASHRVVATARNSEHLVDIASKFGGSVRTVALDVTRQRSFCISRHYPILRWGSCWEVTLTTQLRNTLCKFSRPIKIGSIAAFRLTTAFQTSGS